MAFGTKVEAAQYRVEIIRPTLEYLDPLIPYSKAAEHLIVMTALAESRFDAIGQWPRGPAKGIFQMEPATFNWLYLDWLGARSREALRQRFAKLELPEPVDPVEQLEGNMYFATAMCRLRYWVAPNALPDASDINGLAAYHKRWYNTVAGAAIPAETVRIYREFGHDG